MCNIKGTYFFKKLEMAWSWECMTMAASSFNTAISNGRSLCSGISLERSLEKNSDFCH